MSVESWVTVGAACVQALSAIAIVVLTVLLVRSTQEYGGFGLTPQNGAFGLIQGILDRRHTEVRSDRRGTRDYNLRVFT